jgi:hypothetical protein
MAMLAGCASTGEPQEEELGVVQAIQVGDDALDCQSLQGQIFNAETVVARLTQQIESSKNSARANDAAGALNSYLGNSSLFNTLLASSARDSVDDAREIRDSYQRRRDILLQQYMHKKCSVAAQTQASS